MARDRARLRLPRRISSWFLLFSAVAALWLGAGVWFVAVAGERERIEAAWLTHLRRVGQQLHVGDLRRGAPAPQAAMHRLQADLDLEYCCVVSHEGEIWAHSSSQRVGEIFQEPAAAYERVDGLDRLRFSRDAADAIVLEYRLPLGSGEASPACLHMAVLEPSAMVSLSAGHASLLWLGLGPAVCLAAGSVVLRRMVQPLAAIESQLGSAATAVCPTQLELREVPAGGAAARGWNRLVEAHDRQRADSDFEQRAAAGLQSSTSSQGNNVLNSLPDGLAIASKEGRVIFANRAFGAICGEGGEDGLAGAMMDEILGLRERRGEAQEFLAPASHHRTVAVELRTTLKGIARFLRVARYPFWDGDHRVDTSRHVWSVRDITQQQLVAQTRDQFLQTAAHELRTPLANIKAYAETLSLDDTIDTQRQKEFFNVINAEATRLGRLIEDLLSVSSMEAGALSATREETDFGRLAAEVIDKVKPLMDQKRLQLRTTFPQKWPKTHIDKDKIATSLVNVLGNAAKYTPAGGQVEFRIAVDDGRLTIAVEDTGFGISAEELPRISEKFFRSEDPRVREQPGSGLGLSLVKEVVRLHGGSFDIRSEVGKGTTVKITLPIV